MQQRSLVRKRNGRCDNLISGRTRLSSGPEMGFIIVFRGELSDGLPTFDRAHGNTNRRLANTRLAGNACGKSQNDISVAAGVLVDSLQAHECVRRLEDGVYLVVALKLVVLV